jgi:hypothetical protein
MVKFGKFAWPVNILNYAQESYMRNPAYYHMSLEEILHKFYSTYKKAV